MGWVMRHRWLVAAGATVAAAVVAMVVILVVVVQSPGRNPSGGAGPLTPESIPAAGGVNLAAEVVVPHGSGRFPLVVMPAPWVAKESVYNLLAEKLAGEGFAVVAYAERGSQDSGGAVDMMGPETQGDVSTVISWALAHEPIDPKRIGMMGISYGAGASLLAAEHDPRIKAVVALSAWTDAGFAFDPHDTLSTAALTELLGSAQTTGRLDPQLTTIYGQLRTDPAAAAATVRAMSAVRSPITDVAALNRNGTAVMIANAWEDSIFSPDQLVPFFDRLTTPKRLQLAPGDHGGPELAALSGLPDETVADGIRWLDHYLDGADNGIDRDDPIQVKDVASGSWHGLRRWPTSGTAIPLGRPGQPGDAGPTAAPEWAATIPTGTDSGAVSGPALFLSSQQYAPPVAVMSQIVAADAFEWTVAPAGTAIQVSGTPRLHVDVASSASAASLFAYLYDVDASGTGRLMSFTPYTVTGLVSGTAKPVDIALRPIAWTVPAGDHLALVIDTVDARYAAAAGAGGTLTFSSSASDRATLTVPTSG